MNTLLVLVRREIARRAAQRSDAARFLIVATSVPLVLIALVCFVALAVVFAIAASESSGGCGTSVPVGTAGANTRTAAQIVQYFESQGISANGSAGIVGNLQQENGLSPSGAGLAQWNPGWYATMAAYATSQGLSPTSVAGQLAYIVYDLRTSYAALLVSLNSASDPATAATMFETGYEKCSGVVGFMIVVPGSLCNDPARRSYAVVALRAAGGGTAIPVSLATGGTCVAVGGGGGDPIQGFRPGRDDMGVDACAAPGMPIFAPAASQLVDVVQNWYGPQPLLLFRFTPPLAGTYLNDSYWYVAEQIVPATEVRGTQFAAGQRVATYAPSGTCIEIGWGSPTAGSRTLAGQMGDSAAANPPPGALTRWGESFKRFFHLPWVGQSA